MSVSTSSTSAVDSATVSTEKTSGPTILYIVPRMFCYTSTVGSKTIVENITCPYEYSSSSKQQKDVLTGLMSALSERKYDGVNSSNLTEALLQDTRLLQSYAANSSPPIELHYTGIDENCPEDAMTAVPTLQDFAKANFSSEILGYDPFRPGVHPDEKKKALVLGEYTRSAAALCRKSIRSQASQLSTQSSSGTEEGDLYPKTKRRRGSGTSLF